eukprot:TRINITY_DN18546_c0_g1_i1.p1 TRINITY_DN18546_c0_g1~~TRINITY_DN18546_c0_g1_i1.p1  ORF type:complete len:1913 (+),score=396.59 TRINITY_DN18546_c0_g1_i1:188-5926(+)
MRDSDRVAALTLLVSLVRAVSAASTAVTWRLEVNGETSLSAWSVHDQFNLEVRAATLSGGRVTIPAAGAACGAGAGDIADAAPPELTGFLALSPHADAVDGDERWRWVGLRFGRGGDYSVCWCSDAGSPATCAELASIAIAGPTQLQDGDGAALPQDFASTKAYREEPFQVEVLGVNLSAGDRFRAVPAESSCASATAASAGGDAAIVPAFESGAPEPPPGAGAGDDGVGELESLRWTGLSSPVAGVLRLCWCSARRASEIAGDASDDSRSVGGANDSVASAAASPCASGSASLFDVDVGSVYVAGPHSLVLGGSAARPPAGGPEPLAGGRDALRGHRAVVDLNASLTVRGYGLDAGGLRILFAATGAQCGSESAENNTEYLGGQLEEDPDAPGRSPENASTALSWEPLRFARHGQYHVCWCSGRQNNCTSGAHFAMHLGRLYISPGRGGAGLVGRPRTRAGVEFALALRGWSLARDDQIRIVPGEVPCGARGASRNDAALRGKLAISPDEPGEAVADAKYGTISGLHWAGLRLTSAGLRRVCWCPGSGEGAPAAVDLCAHDSGFYEDLGYLVVVLVRSSWVDSCARARQPFRAHLAGIDLRFDVDRILLTYATETCGEALPRGSNPAGDLAANFGFAGFRCTEDPNAGSEPMERKLVCGDNRRTLQVPFPGLYKICLCVALPGYDCSDIGHYTIDTGAPFEVAAVAGPLSSLNSAANGGGAQAPMMLGGTTGAVLAVAYAPPPPEQPDVPARLAAASEDGSIRLWEPAFPRMVSELVGHESRVDALAWNPNASWPWLVSGDADGSLRLWGEKAGVAPGQAMEHPCPRWAPVWQRPNGNASDSLWQDIIFGQLLDVPFDTVLLEDRAYEQDRVNASDLKDATNLTRLRAGLQCAKVCPTFREQAMEFCDCGPTFECHLLGNCRPRCGLEYHVWREAHASRITAVAVTADGAYIVSASVDTTVRIWDVMGDISRATSMGESRALARPYQTFDKHSRAVLSVICLASTEPGINIPAIASGGSDGRIMWYEAPNATRFEVYFKELHEIPDALGARGLILAMALTSDGSLFAAASAEGGAVWDTLSRVKIRDLIPSSSTSGAAVAGLTISPDDRWLALRTSAQVQLWQLSGDDEDEKEDQAPARPVLPGEWVQPRGTWMPFGGDDLGRTTLSWTLRSGPRGNQPRYEVRHAENGSVTDLLLSPCTLEMDKFDANGGNCADNLPIVQIDLEVPFEFIGVRGSFEEYSFGENHADDCRGGLPHSSWEDLNASYAYFTRLAQGASAEGKDCERIGPRGDEGRESAKACERECLLTEGLCNVFNYRQSPPNCDLRRCLNISRLELRPNSDKDVYVHVTRVQADEITMPTHDGYVMFGAPDAAGLGGILYGGCGAGPDIPNDPGVVIQIKAQPVPRTRRLRWQVAQSRRGETLGIRRVKLELLRPDTDSRVLAEISGSPALDFSPSKRELAAAVGDSGDFAVWDLTGFDIVAKTYEHKLKTVFDFALNASDLQEQDRMRVVLADDIAACGNAYSSVNTLAVQGVYDGRRSGGNPEYAEWMGIVATVPAEYRICYCRSRSQGCCTADADFATQIGFFTVAGARDGHYFVCEVTHSGGTRDCRLTDVKGVGLRAGDMVMVQEGPACGLGVAARGIPENAVAVSRDYEDPVDLKRYAAGTWYRFEHEISTDWGKDFKSSPLTTTQGYTARVCWCAQISQCSPTRPSDFIIELGLITVVHLPDRTHRITCIVGVDCKFSMDLATSHPFAEGDLAVVRVGRAPPQSRLGRQTYCAQSENLLGIGPKEDGFSARMVTSTDADGNTIGTFDLERATFAKPGVYRICWCQASLMPCDEPEDFNYDIGQIEVVSADYVYPQCTATEVQFTGWREWKTFDECCCNYNEAGALGCQEENSFAFETCSKLPRR